jgi:cellulose synthase/poly-beta-1,6-N-acetylglucosamine synthase-like glycosyltransferase
VSGFRAVQGVVSGDDDLLLQAAAQKKAGIRYAVESEAAVRTEPTPTLRVLWEQRKRWSSKTVFYNEKQIVFLSGVFLYYGLIFLGLLSGTFFHGLLLLAGPVFLFKTLLDYYLFRTGAILFDQKALLPYFPLAALFHIPLILFACLFGVFGKFTWKGATGGKKVA